MKDEKLYIGKNGTLRVIKHKETKGAKFSKCGKYRYRLWRIWDDTKPVVMVIGINPSNANEDKDDPTIRNIRTMLTKLGYGGFYMMNLFSLISSKPEELTKVEDPVGYLGVELIKIAERVSEIIFCWGTPNKVRQIKEITAKRIIQVADAFPQAKVFSFNQDGSPSHPMSMMYKGLVNNPPKLENYDRR